MGAVLEDGSLNFYDFTVCCRHRLEDSPQKLRKKFVCHFFRSDAITANMCDIWCFFRIDSNWSRSHTGILFIFFSNEVLVNTVPTIYEKIIKFYWAVLENGTQTFIVLNLLNFAFSCEISCRHAAQILQKKSFVFWVLFDIL